MSPDIGMYNVTSGTTTTYTVPHATAEDVVAGDDGNVWLTGGGIQNETTFLYYPSIIGCIGLTAGAQASSLSIATQPGDVTAGDGFGLVVAVDSSSGALDTFYQGTVSISLAIDPSGNATLGGTLTAAVKNGEAVFAGLTLNNAGTGYVIQATATGIASATTGPFNVASSAAYLVVTTEPPSNVAAATEFITVVSAEDGNGNVDASYDQAITLTLLNNTEGATLGGTVTEGAQNGVATFTDLTVSEPGDGYALQAASGTLATGQSSEFDVTAPPATYLLIASGPPSTLVAGTQFSLVVDAQDTQGYIDTSYNGLVTLVLSGGPSQATLGGTLQVDATTGVATFSGLTLDLAGSGYTINVAGGSLTGVATGDITVTPAATYQLLIQTQPSSTATAGQPFAIQPIVSEVDQFGNLETSGDSTALTASLASGNGPLHGTTTMTVSGGLATFTDLADNRSGIISLNFASQSLTAGPSNNIFISPAAAANLVIQTPPYAQVTAGTPLTDPIVIDEEDQFGNVETGDNSTVVKAALASGAGSLKGTSTATVTAGVASFDDLEDDTAGTLSLQFAAGSLPAVISAPSIVAPAPATQLKVTQRPAGVIAGVGFGLTLMALDDFGNVDTSFGGSVTVALASGSSGALSGARTQMASGGLVTFTNLTDTTSGSISFNVTSGALTPATTSPVPVKPAQASKLVIETQPSTSATAGQVFATQSVVLEEDEFGNPETSDNSTVITASLASGTGSLHGVTTATVSGGVATFSGLAENTAGTISLMFTGPGSSSVPSATIVVSPATASKLVIGTEPAGTAAPARHSSPSRSSSQRTSSATWRQVTTAR